MSSVVADQGWYPDRDDPTNMRWWDGVQWTPHTRPAVGGHSTPTFYESHGGLNIGATASKGRNHYSLITFAVGALYLLIAFLTHFVLVGFVPLAFSMRAKRSAEPLAPLALAAAVGVIVISLLTLLH